MAIQCLYNLAIYYGYYWLDATAIATATMMPIHPSTYIGTQVYGVVSSIAFCMPGQSLCPTRKIMPQLTTPAHVMYCTPRWFMHAV